MKIKCLSFFWLLCTCHVIVAQLTPNNIYYLANLSAKVACSGFVDTLGEKMFLENSSN